MDEQAERERDLRILYRGVFLQTTEGRAVLAHLLSDLGYPGAVNAAEEEVRRNVAVELLKRLGVLEDFNFPAFVDALVAIPLEDTERKRNPQKAMATTDRVARWKSEVG